MKDQTYPNTPLPWRVRNSVVVESDCGRMVADCAVVEGIDEVPLRAGLANAQNAAMIVRCVNSHADLLHVCAEVIAMVDSGTIHQPGLRGDQWREKLGKQARSAIAKATGEV